MVSLAMGHLLRSEGHARPASAGMMFGGILNVALDPLFIFVFHMNVAGAAIATALSNAASVIFFVIQYIRLRDRTDVSCARAISRSALFALSFPWVWLRRWQQRWAMPPIW